MTLLPSLEVLVPADHLQRCVDRVLYLSFVPEAVRDKCSVVNSRPSVDPGGG